MSCALAVFNTSGVLQVMFYTSCGVLVGLYASFVLQARSIKWCSTLVVFYNWRSKLRVSYTSRALPTVYYSCFCTSGVQLSWFY